MVKQMPEQRSSAYQSPPQETARLMRLATYASVLVACLLIIAKGVAWQLSGSVSLLATLIDSCLDVLASLVNMAAVGHALAPADAEHRFGHGKAEALAGLGQALLIAGSGAYLFFQSVERLANPVPLEAYGLGVAVMLFSIAATLALVLFQRRVVRSTGSIAISADALHYRADLLVNVTVILALLLSNWGWPGFDGLFALFIGLYVVFSAWKIVRGSVDHLMDRELPDAEREQIRKLALAHSAVRGVHDLRSRQSGAAVFIQFHLELDEDLRLPGAHRIAAEVEDRIRQSYPGAEIIIHLDPVSAAPLEPLPAQADDN